MREDGVTHPHLMDQHMNPAGREREERGKGGREEIEGRGERRNCYVWVAAITAIANGSD